MACTLAAVRPRRHGQVGAKGVSFKVQSHGRGKCVVVRSLGTAFMIRNEWIRQGDRDSIVVRHDNEPDQEGYISQCFMDVEPETEMPTLRTKRQVVMAAAEAGITARDHGDVISAAELRHVLRLLSDRTVFMNAVGRELEILPRTEPDQRGQRAVTSPRFIQFRRKPSTGTQM